MWRLSPFWREATVAAVGCFASATSSSDAGRQCQLYNSPGRIPPPALQPLPPADIMAAAAVLFAAGGRLAPGSGVGPGAGSRLGSHALGLQSYYAPWILVDLAHWADSGISKVSNIVPLPPHRSVSFRRETICLAGCHLHVCAFMCACCNFAMSLEIRPAPAAGRREGCYCLCAFRLA